MSSTLVLLDVEVNVDCTILSPDLFLRLSKQHRQTPVRQRRDPQIENLQQRIENILSSQIFKRPFRAVIFDERKTASSENVVVDAVDVPVEVRLGELCVCVWWV